MAKKKATQVESPAVSLTPSIQPPEDREPRRLMPTNKVRGVAEVRTPKAADGIRIGMRIAYKELMKFEERTERENGMDSNDNKDFTRIMNILRDFYLVEIEARKLGAVRELTDDQLKEEIRMLLDGE